MGLEQRGQHGKTVTIRQRRIVCRHPQRHKALELNTGARLLESDLRDLAALTRAFERCGAVVNLLGILNQGKHHNSFRHVHVELVDQVIDAARAAGPTFRVNLRSRPRVNRLGRAGPWPSASPRGATRTGAEGRIG